jgi:hypothetical protein
MNDKRNDEIAERQPTELAKPQLGPGRLGTYTALGAMTGTVPLPWIPDVVARRIRGALAHDVAARHGLSITPDARKVLAEPAGPEGPRSFIGHAANFLAGKLLAKVGPLWVLGPVRNGAQTYVLGHLMHRYLSRARKGPSIRIDVEEARVLRKAIDEALLAVVMSDVHGAPDEAAQAPEDFRDSTTVLADGFIIGAASLPGWLVRRLEAAFDQVLARATPAE